MAQMWPPPKPKLQQSAFDEAVQTNIEDFDMEVSARHRPLWTRPDVPRYCTGRGGDQVCLRGVHCPGLRSDRHHQESGRWRHAEVSPAPSSEQHAPSMHSSAPMRTLAAATLSSLPPRRWTTASRSSSRPRAPSPRPSGASRRSSATPPPTPKSSTPSRSRFVRREGEGEGRGEGRSSSLHPAPEAGDRRGPFLLSGQDVRAAADRVPQAVGGLPGRLPAHPAARCCC